MRLQPLSLQWPVGHGPQPLVSQHSALQQPGHYEEAILSLLTQPSVYQVCAEPCPHFTQSSPHHPVREGPGHTARREQKQNLSWG